ncbi:MAG: MYG1 family protein [Lachnospiraceae bacterium]|nr:MYG1 family protein [Lachnospiraceae bacterium]
MLKMTNDPMKATGITHAGVFHADDVFSTAFLMEYFTLVRGCPFRVMRLSNLPSKDHYNSGAIVYDIGMGQFDHHGERVDRENGVPYAAFGKLWKEFGYSYVSKLFPDNSATDNSWIRQKFDSIFIQGIDAVDNGTMPLADYPAQAMSVSSVIANMNPSWEDDSPLAEQMCFCNAVRLAKEIMGITLDRLFATAKAKHRISKALSCVQNKGTILVLDKFCPWQEEIINGGHSAAENLLYIMYPSKRNTGYWKWQVVPTAVGSFDQRCHVPEHWCGKTGDALYHACRMSGMTFIHKSGFLGECISKADAYEAVETIIDLAIHRGELIDTGDTIIRAK